MTLSTCSSTAKLARFYRKVQAVNPSRNNFQNYLDKDPEGHEICNSISNFAGKKLFARRDFNRNDFIVCYRGKRLDPENALDDNLYCFLMDRKVANDDSECVDILGR